MKKIAFIFLIVSAFLALISCSKKDSSSESSIEQSSGEDSADSAVAYFSTVEKDNSDMAFGLQKMQMMSYEGQIWNIYAQNGKLIYGVYDWKEDEKNGRYMDTSTLRLYTCNPDGSDLTEIATGLKKTDCGLSDCLSDGENIWVLAAEKEENSDHYNNYLLKIENSGITEKESIPASVLSNSYGRAIDRNGNFYSIESKNIFVVKKNGEVVTIDLGNTEGGAITVNSEGRIFALCFTKEDSIITEINTENLEMMNSVSVGKNVLGSLCLNGCGDFDLFLSLEGGITGYDFDNRRSEKIVDFTTSYIHGTPVGMIDADTVVEREMDNETLECRPKVYRKIDPDIIKNQKVLKLAVFTSFYRDILSEVENFIAENPGIRIEIVDYNSLYGEKAYEQLGIEITQGNGPDIYSVDGNVAGLTADQCIQKGMFASLDEYFEKDGKVKTSDIIPSVLSAMQSNGKIYCTAKRFTVNAILAKKTILGDIKGWDLKEFEQFVHGYGKDIYYFGGSRSERFSNLLFSYLASYVDTEKGNVDFLNDEFRIVLELAKEAKSDDELGNYSRNDSFKKDETILIPWTVEYSDVTRFEFGDDFSFVGFPAKDKNGKYFSFSGAYAIAASSKNKEEAWKFVSYGMSEEEQETMGVYSVRQRVFDESLKEKIDSGSMSSDEAEVYKAAVDSAKKGKVLLPGVENIIYEEAERYFNDEKTIEEVQKLIQNRVEIYVSENK